MMKDRSPVIKELKLTVYCPATGQTLESTGEFRKAKLNEFYFLGNFPHPHIGIGESTGKCIIIKVTKNDYEVK